MLYLLPVAFLWPILPWFIGGKKTPGSGLLGFEHFQTQTGGDKVMEVRIPRDPGATVFDREGGMPGIPHPLARRPRDFAHPTEKLPVPVARGQQPATGRLPQGVDHREGLRQRCGARGKIRMGHYPHKSRGRFQRERKGLRAGGELLQPAAIIAMSGIIRPVGVDQHIDVRHAHGDQRPSSRNSASCAGVTDVARDAA